MLFVNLAGNAVPTKQLSQTLSFKHPAYLATVLVRGQRTGNHFRLAVLESCITRKHVKIYSLIQVSMRTTCYWS